MENMFKHDNFLSNWLSTNPRDRLTPEEECSLTSRVQQSDKVRQQIKKEGRAATTFEEEILYDGQDAYNQLVECNIPLSIHFAKKYAEHYPNLSLTVDDLTQEASIGIMKAALKYDSTQNTKFSTYAAYWINQGIRRAIEDKADMIRKPASAHSRARMVHKIDAQFNCHMDTKIVSSMTGISEDEVEFVRFLDNAQITSMDQAYFSDDEDEQSFHETIADDTDVQKEVTGAVEREILIAMIDSIQNNETAKIIEKMHLGFFEGGPMTAAEIAVLSKDNLTPAEVQKIIDEVENDLIRNAESLRKSNVQWLQLMKEKKKANKR
ncbi:MAG: sigma-70 family RNA polymerase sigma factor [Anaerolineaceae bacterium]|nr:sigma-70 family RNA polymerase sigma factor [Anaerolineaceae bacterium]